MNKAMLITAPSEAASLIEQTLRAEGFSAVNVISAGSEARRVIKSGSQPSLIVINTPLPDCFGSELAEDLADETSAKMILICRRDIADELSARLSDYDVTVLSAPVSREELSAHFLTEGVSGLSRETPEIMERIEEMRVINRAKTVLMKYLKFTEPQAHRYLEKQAMNNRRTRRETAEHIIKQYEK